MPIQISANTSRLEQHEFGRIAYEVMRCLFAIHHDFGRFFEENIYQRELRQRYPGTQLEVPLEVQFEGFRKQYSLDALVEEGAVFELKTVESLVDRHRSQLLHYLFLADLSHGKLVNLRTEQVQHEFINTKLRPEDRKRFIVTGSAWEEIGAQPLKEWCVALLREVGTGLDLSLYEEALTYLLGGEEQVLQEVNVLSNKLVLGPQKFRLVTPDVAFKITALTDAPSLFEKHARRLLEHTHLKAIQWINVTPAEVSFQTIRS